MSLVDESSVAKADETTQQTATAATPDKAIVLTRRGIDKVLIGFGVLATLVFVVAGGLLLWGSNFADDYVHDELTSQRISFPPEEALLEEGRDDLVKYADQPLDTGKEAEAYASFIDGHLERIGGGMTYAELGGPQTEARAALAAAQEAGAPDDEIAQLQADVDQVTAQRETMFKGETLRGLLLSSYAWATVGQVAGVAAIAAFATAAVMLVLVVLGFVHLRKLHS